MVLILGEQENGKRSVWNQSMENQSSYTYDTFGWQPDTGRGRRDL